MSFQRVGSEYKGVDNITTPERRELSKKEQKLRIRQEKILSSVENIGKKIDECSRERPKTLWTSIKVANWRNLAKIKLHFMKKKGLSGERIGQFLHCAYTAYASEIRSVPGKSFADILRKQGINLLDFNGPVSRELFKAALTDPTFREVPLVISKAKEEKRDSISADMKEYGSKIMLPDEIRDKYETAETTEALAEAIKANREYAAQKGSETQENIYGGQIFENDLNRTGCNLKIIDEGTNKTINIMISNNPDFCGEENCLMSKDQKTWQRSSFMDPSIPKKEKLDAVLTQIKQQSQKQGLELKDSEAFSLLKQFVLGYRGQNGMTDLYSYTFDLLAENSLLLGLNDPNTYMKFSKQEEKVDLTCIIDEVGVSKVALVTGQEENVSQNYNFGFIYPKGIQNPQEKDILSELGVKSTPKRNDAGQITGWECPFRANPPTHFILYGGATPAKDPQDTF